MSRLTIVQRKMLVRAKTVQEDAVERRDGELADRLTDPDELQPHLVGPWLHSVVGQPASQAEHPPVRSGSRHHRSPHVINRIRPSARRMPARPHLSMLNIQRRMSRRPPTQWCRCTTAARGATLAERKYLELPARMLH